MRNRPEIVGEGESSGVSVKPVISRNFRRRAIQFARLHADNDPKRPTHRTAAAGVMIMPDSHDLENAAQHSQTPTNGPTSTGDDVLDIIADVEGRLERLRKVSKESGAVVDSIHQKQAALEKRQKELDARAEQLEQATAALQQRAEELNRKEKHVESLCELADGERKEIDQLRQTVEADRGALSQDRAALEEQQTTLDNDRERLGAEQREFDERVRALEADRESLKQQLNELQEQRSRCDEEQRAAMQAVDQRMDELQQQRDDRAEELQSQLDEARKQVAALKEHLEVQRAEVGKLEKSHQAEIEQGQLRADSLQSDLDAAQTKVSELEAALSKAKSDLKTRHEQLEATKNKLMELGRALDGQSEQLQAGAAALAALEDRDRRIAELESQLTSSSGGNMGGVDPGEVASRDQRIAELESQLADLSTQSAESAAADPGELASRDERIAALEQEIQSLEAQVRAAAQTASTSTEGTDEELAKRDHAIEELSKHIRSLQSSLKQAQSETAERSNEVSKLRSTVEKLKKAASPAVAAGSVDDTFSTRRRQRLQRMRQAIHDRSRRLNKARDVVKQQAHVVREIEDEKRTLQDVRRNLELAEQRMIRRWARSSTVTNLFFVVLSLAILGASSYFGVMTFWPTAYTATAVIEAKGKPGFPLTDTQTNLWQAVHEQMLLSDTVVDGIAERLRQRGYNDLSDSAALRTFLETNLVTASPQPGTIKLELTTTGRDEVQRLLETYSIGLVSASNAERGRRTDGATTTLAVPATVEPLPAKDNRVQVAGIVFGSSVGAFLLLGLPLYVKLRRSTSVFADDDIDTPLMGAERWDKITNGSTQSDEHVIS